MNARLRYAVVAAVLVALAALAGFLVSVSLGPVRVANAVEPAPVVVADAPAVDPFLADLMPGTEVAPERAEKLLLAADRVCEGVTAGVPVVDMANALAVELADPEPLTDEEARTFVNLAATTHCSARSA